MATYCIYHANCLDGFTAAWAVSKAHPDWELVPGFHGREPSSELLHDIAGQDVYFVDFSYKLPIMANIAIRARSITVLDHHKSAVEEMTGHCEMMGLGTTEQNIHQNEEMFAHHCQKKGILPIRCLFDMERSGAGLAWDYFHPGKERPTVLKYVQDRDLWKFEYPETKAITAALHSFDQTLLTWDWCMSPLNFDRLLSDGEAIMRKDMKDITGYIKSTAHRAEIDGYDVPALNAPYMWSSEAGHILAQGEPFAAVYWYTKDGVVFSLRSTDEGVDVSEIAVRHGGGGHRNAAGFKVASSGDADIFFH